MTKIISSRNMGKSEQGWLHSIFHFSFAEYYNPQNMQYGSLRVVNDDIFDHASGFDTHPHQNMEIISYVVDGILTHKDSLGNKRELTRGQVQYMSAGTGIQHSEHNLGTKPLRFLQIWILPDRNGHTPQYGDHRFKWEDRHNKWLVIASGKKDEAPIHIHQDATLSVISMDAETSQTATLKSGRKAYLIQIEGRGTVNGKSLQEKDAAEITGDQGDSAETIIELKAATDSHYILFDLST